MKYRPILFASIILLLIYFSFLYLNKKQNQQEINDNKGSLEGFLDIKWGEFENSIKTKMLKRDKTKFEGRLVSPDDPEEISLLFKSGNFGSHYVDTRFISLDKKNGFYSASVELPMTADMLFEYYKQIRTEIVEKYKDPQLEQQNSFSAWKFPSSKAPEAEIMLAIGEKDSKLLIHYNYIKIKTLVDKRDSERRKKEKIKGNKDY
jgi:hypothetical protein